VDKVDAEKIEKDRRLPFGLPGVNKEKKVSNGNYLWISYFWSYLNATGRAGFVMSSQASSAGHGEAEVRRKLVETGDVDVMISIRSNFFYTRTVPCELWHFDRSKPKSRRDTVLMLDARHIYRKVTRKIYDFSPEQLQNLTAIVWLYRGETDRFAALLDSYRERLRTHRRGLVAALPDAGKALGALASAIKACGQSLSADFQTEMIGASDDCTALVKLSTQRDFSKDSTSLPDFAAACRRLIHRVRALGRVVDPLVAITLEETEDKKLKKELKAERERTDATWAAALKEAEST
jgi:type I restriction-modification system DNA methylase subunit